MAWLSSSAPSEGALLSSAAEAGWAPEAGIGVEEGVEEGDSGKEAEEESRGVLLLLLLLLFDK